MNESKYTFNLVFVITRVLFRRIFNIKKYPNWSLKTEIIWATSRLTLLSSNEYGLPWLKSLSKKFTPKPKMGKKVNIEHATLNGTVFLKITPLKPYKSDSAIIYFHGGGYVLGSPEATLEFSVKLSSCSNLAIYVPDYPKAPEMLYPKAHTSSIDFVRDISGNYDDLLLMGDSAGAALVLSTFKNLKAVEKDKISGTVLISPWIDPLASAGSINYNADNDVGNRTFVTNCYRLYLGQKTENPEHPMTFDKSNIISMPRTFVSVGSAEILFSQVSEFQNNLLKMDTKVHFRTYKNMFHTFWNHPKNIGEAMQLIHDISNWIFKWE
ncbi:alpha/beta hydrolase [Flagellimonas nanhaiensis]|nr:alpha/beta hydrolase [Allomuricauda nanhaiensis]